MSSKLVGLVPNVCIGADTAKFNAFVSELQPLSPRHIDRGIGTDRTVISFYVGIEEIESLAKSFLEHSYASLSLDGYKSAHPYSGAVDVFPFVYMDEGQISLVKPIALKVAEWASARFGVPVFLYGQLSEKGFEPREFRKGGVEQLWSRLNAGELRAEFTPPDLSYERFRRTGALLLGLREPLIAYNVTLDLQQTGKSVDRTVRSLRHTSRGGLEGVRAMSWFEPNYCLIQVSTNITKPRLVSLGSVYLLCEELAKSHGVSVLGSEVIGLVPDYALEKAASELGINSQPSWLEELVSRLNLNLHGDFKAEARVISSQWRAGT